MNRWLLWLWLIAIHGLVYGYAFGASSGTESTSSSKAGSFLGDLQVLTNNPNRMAGFENGSLKAGRYVESRLRKAGFQEVYVQEFPLIMSRTTECRLETNGKSYAIHAMRPNALQAVVTPAEGISGETLYAGKGNLEDYGIHNPKDRIVVLDYESESNWLHAFAFGARAVLFLEPDSAAMGGRTSINLPANLPRFWIGQDIADSLELKTKPVQVRLNAASKWEPKKGRNVIAVLRGTAPAFSKGNPPEAILMAAPLDSYSDVPEIAPGARDAANCAALLQMALSSLQSPPKRDLIFCFYDGQTQNHAGARAFYGGIYRRMRDKKIAEGSLEDRILEYQEEYKYLSRIIGILSKPDLTGQKGRLNCNDANTLQMLREEVRRKSGQTLEALRIARLQRTQSSVPDASGNGKKNISSTAPEIKDPNVQALESIDLGWNSLLRDLDGGIITTSTRPFFTKILKETLGFCHGRLSEIESATSQTKSSIVLRDAIGPDRNTIILHVGLNFGDANSRWSFIHGDDTEVLGIADSQGIYGNVFKAIREAAEGKGQQWGNFDKRPVEGLYDSRLFAPGYFADSSSMARTFGLMNLSLMTISDPLIRQGQPDDTLDRLNWQAIDQQSQEAGRLLIALADSPSMSLATQLTPMAVIDEVWWAGNRSTGPSVREVAAGSGLRAQNVRGALVSLYRGGTWDSAVRAFSVRGFCSDILVMTNLNGFFEIGPYAQMRYNKQLLLLAATIGDTDPGESTKIGSISSPGNGLINRVITRASSEKILIGGRLQDLAIDLCQVQGRSFVGYGYDRGIVKTLVMRAMSTTEFPMDRHMVFEAGNVLALYSPLDAAGTKVFNKSGMVLLANSQSPKDYQGHGVTMTNAYTHELVPERTAKDLQILNDYRLEILRDNRIAQPSLEALSGVAKDIREDSPIAREIPAASVQPTSLEQRVSKLAAAASYSRSVYEPVMGVMNDLVVAVVLLLLLTIPFAFALERLIIGTPHIYRQIGWFSVFFILSFVLLYYANPAFRLASTPIIIFLAFAIILLSTLVIFIMMRKLQAEMRKLQGLAGSSHGADVSRLSTTMAAVKMGISTMRRRPLRTFLTASTVVLLTFTILTFASFGSTWGVKKTYEGPLNSKPQILVRHQQWNPIPDEIYKTLKGFLHERAEVTARYWVSPMASELAGAQAIAVSLEKLVMTEDLQKAIPLSAFVGIDKRDIEHDPSLRSLFDESAAAGFSEDGVYLSKAISETLGLKTSDIGKKRLLVKGLPLLYAGIFGESIATHTQLDGSKILPVDYESSSGGDLAGLVLQQQQAIANDSTDGGAAQFITYSLDSVAIVSASAARKLGGRICSLSIHPRELQDLQEMGEEITTITSLPAYVGDQGGVQRFFFTTLMEASGTGDLLLPILLGGLIVFATMLGSVSDREREIYTFSSLGLGPAHVASLFLAEAGVYAVLGGMGGYLLGQVVSRILGWLSVIFEFTAPSMNFGSVNAIVTILIVVVTVLLSAIYPAIKASRSANPGIQRTWRIPQSDGDVLRLVFPFTVSAYDITGIVSFLEEHFRNYSEPGLGVFACTEVGVSQMRRNSPAIPADASAESFEEPRNSLAIRATVALAPFDLGIEQSFEMINIPSDIEGVDEVHVTIRRLSGSQNDWRRSVKVFINDLRRQFLVWRALSEEAVEHYREQTLSRWSLMPVVSEAPVQEELEATGSEAG